MRTLQNLQDILLRIDGKGYKAYQDIKGSYQAEQYTLIIDHVQSDPFAPPTKVRAAVPQAWAQFPPALYDQPEKKTAVIDYLTRRFEQSIHSSSSGRHGTEKSGLIAVDHCGQEMLLRTSVAIDNDIVEARFEIGLPAAGRRILGQPAIAIFFNVLPKVISRSLYFSRINQEALQQQVHLAVDQACIRKELEKRNLVAFIANGAVLPRESGVSDRPLIQNVIPFHSPPSLEVEFQLPHRGLIKGMGIPEGITLIVGGGYHGKSTLLQAVERGVYNHIEGDGREFVITRENSVKIRAEDGRRVEKVNISPFINHLPNSQETRRFSTENASGSTSQAANIMEALEMGIDTLLIDEDTSATNFMIRDARMQQLVHKDKEPITPFIDRVRQLYTDLTISTILVVGGSGDYFDVADTVIMMDEYRPREVTQKARQIAMYTPNQREQPAQTTIGRSHQRVLSSSSFPIIEKGIKVHGLHSLTYNHSSIDLSNVEQLVDISQTRCIAAMIEYLVRHVLLKDMPMTDAVFQIYQLIEAKGLDAISPYTGHPGNLALPRRYELAAAINRCRHLSIK